MERWTDSQNCAGRVFCRSCRDPGRVGAEWRRRIARVWLTEPGLFACPHGVRRENLPRLGRRRGLGDLVAWVARRLGLKQCGGCRRRRRRLNQWLPWPRWLMPL